MEYKERKEQLEFEALKEICRHFLKSELVIDTDFERFEGYLPAYKTADDAFFFTPLMGNPVMRGRTLLGEKPIPNRFWYALRVIQCLPGGRWEPDEYDVVEINRAESIQNCILLAAKYFLSQEFSNAAEASYWNIEAQLQKEFPNLLDEY